MNNIRRLFHTGLSMIYLGRIASLIVLLFVIAACGSADDPTSAPVPESVETESLSASGEISMGGGALGGSAQTTLLAQEILAQTTQFGRSTISLMRKSPQTLHRM